MLKNINKKNILKYINFSNVKKYLLEKENILWLVKIQLQSKTIQKHFFLV